MKKNVIALMLTALLLLSVYWSSVPLISADYTVENPYMPLSIGDVGDLGGKVGYVPVFFAFDGKVDAYDLALFIACYNKQAPQEAMYLGDLGSQVNGIPTFGRFDDVVDAWDLALFIQCLNKRVDPPVAYSTSFEFTVPSDGNEVVWYYLLARVYLPQSLDGKSFSLVAGKSVDDAIRYVKIDSMNKCSGATGSFNVSLGSLRWGYHMLEFEYGENVGGGTLNFTVKAYTGEYAWLSRFRIYVPNYSDTEYRYSVITNTWCPMKDEYFLIGYADDFIDDFHVDGIIWQEWEWNCTPYDNMYTWDGFCYPMGNLENNIGLNAYQISFNFGEINAAGLLDFRYTSWSKQTNRIGSQKFYVIPGQTTICNNTIAEDGGGILNVNDYYNSSNPPQCIVVGPSGEFADAPQTMPTGNSLYIRIAGYDYSNDSANAYCYFKLCNINAKINATTMLSFWMWVYKTPQSNGHIFIDGVFTPALRGASTLRNVMPNGTHLVDQFGERIHAGDHFAPWGSWQHYTVDLSKLYNETQPITLTYLMVAYDDGIEANGRGGNDQFCAYIDGVQIYDAPDQPSVTVNISNCSPIPSGSFALVYSAYSNELVSNTSISGSFVLCKALWGKVNIYLCNAGGVWWAGGDLQIEPGWNVVSANVGTPIPTPKARVYVTWVNMSDNTVHPVAGGQVTKYYSGGSTSASTNDRGIANFTLSTTDKGQNYIIAQYTAADGSVFTSKEEFVNATLDRFVVLNLAVSAPSMSGTVINSTGKYFEPLFQLTAFIEDDQLRTSVTFTPYYNLSTNYIPQDWVPGNLLIMWNVTALVSYWILNDTSNNRLILYTHENVTYIYYASYDCEFIYQINSPSLTYLWPTAEGSSFTETYTGLDFKNPFVVNSEYYPGDLLYIAEYDYCGIDEDTTLTFDGAFTVQKLKAENSTVNGMEIVGMYVVGYAQINSAEDYLLDQGAAYLYQLYDAYAPDGPSLSQIQNFRSGNHNGSDAISFTLHGYNCVYTSRFLDFSPKPYFALASALVCGSSNTAYYQDIADVYLSARSWLLNNAGDYPALAFYSFEQDSANQWMRSTLLKRQACYQAALDQMTNNTVGAAIDPAWYNSKNGGNNWNWNSWHNSIVRPSFYNATNSSWSSLSIDNYEPSLYMGIVQAYIQELEQGSIQQNCTFIDIEASPIEFLWIDSNPAMRRTITFQALKGEYFTIVKTHWGDLSGPDLKESRIEIWWGENAFAKTVHLISIVMKINGIIFYVYGCMVYFSAPGTFTVASIAISAIDGGVLGVFKAVGMTVLKMSRGRLLTYLLSHMSTSLASGFFIVFSAVIFGIMCRELALALGASETEANLVFFGGTAGFLIGVAMALKLSGLMLGIAVVGIVICIIAIVFILVWILIH